MPSRSILVIDDQPALLRHACLLLTRLGYEARPAGTVAEAVRVVAEGEQPDLVLMNVLLPGMKWQEAMQRLRDQRIHAPLVIMGAYEGEYRQLVLGYRSLGVLDYLLKPFDQPTLEACLEKIWPKN